MGYKGDLNRDVQSGYDARDVDPEGHGHPKLGNPDMSTQKGSRFEGRAN
jgi:hypothetical protein